MDNFSSADAGFTAYTEADDPESAGERIAEIIAQSCISDDDGDDAAKAPNRPLLPLTSSIASLQAMATGSWNVSVGGTTAAVSAISAASPPQQPLHPHNLEIYQLQQLCAQQQLLLHLAPQPRLAPALSSPPLTGMSTAYSSPQIPACSSPLFGSHPSSPDCFTPPRSASPPAQSSPVTIRRSSPAVSSPGDTSSLGGSPTSVLGQRGGGMEGWDLLYAAAQKIEQQQKKFVQRGGRIGPSCAMNLEARFASRINHTAGSRSPSDQQQPQQHLRRQQQQHLQQPQCRRGGTRHRGGASALSGSPQVLRNPLPHLQQQQPQQGSPLRRCSTTQSVDNTRKLCQTLSAPHRQLSSLPPSAAVAADAACLTPVLASPASPAHVASACPPSPLLLGGTGVFHPMRSSPPLAAASHPAASAASHIHAHSQRHTADGSSGSGSNNGSGSPRTHASPSSARGGGCKKANRPAPTVYLPARLVKVLGLDVDPESNVVLGRSTVAAAAAAGPQQQQQQQQQQQATPTAAASAVHPRQQRGNENKAAVVVRPAPIIKLAPDNIATGKRGGCGGNGGRGWRSSAHGCAAGAPPGGYGRRASGRPAGAATSLAPATPAAPSAAPATPSVPAALAGVAAQPTPGQGSTEWPAAVNLPVEWVY